MIEYLIRKRTAVFTAALLIIFIGITAYMNLPRESNPEITQPWIFVNTVYPGVAPQEIESLISMPLEEELAGIEGVNKISSSSRQSISSIFVEFDADTGVETALRRVKDRIDTAKADLPSEAEDPRVSEFSSTDWPVFIAVISHPEGVLRIDNQARQLKESLKRLPGVLDVDISGNLQRELAIEIDPAKLHYYSLTLDDVAAAVRGENASIPGGMLKSDVRTFSLAVTGEIRNPDNFNNIVVSDSPRTIRIRDLGHAGFTATEAESLARLNGSPAITLEIKKRTGANIIDLSGTIRDHIDTQKESFPEKTEIVYSYDASQYIKESIVDLENNMFSGFVLVLLMTLFFLGFRNSLFVSLAIPFSMLISFFVLQLSGITLNSIVLFSLIMALGMLVDNGIVIVENIFRHAAMGKDRAEAAVDGTKEVAGPIIASTITTCLAFLPIIFMPGIMGQFMSYMPLTIITVLGSSLLVALTINPVFCSRFMSISDRDMLKMTEGSGFFQPAAGRLHKTSQGRSSKAGRGSALVPADRCRGNRALHAGRQGAGILSRRRSSHRDYRSRSPAGNSPGENRRACTQY
jgi:multidrug efflux pump